MSEMTADDPELSYLKARETEARQEMATTLRSLEKLGGPRLGVDDVTPAIIDEVLDQVVDFLKLSGSVGLAERYLAAFRAWRRADQELCRVTARLTIDERPVTEVVAECQSVRDAANDAHESFERVSAEVDVWWQKKQTE